MRLPILSVLFCSIIITANLMAAKMIDVFCFTLPAAVICYPFCFVLGDLLTEFHGFRTTRKIVLLTFLTNAMAIGFLTLATLMKPSRFYQHNEAFVIIHQTGLRILGASFAAFVLSGLLNSFIFDLIKRRAHPLLVRSSVSTLIGVIIDSAVFITLAFCGVLPTNVLLLTILGQILAKILVGIVIGTPLTWCVVRIMKRFSK